MLRGIISLCPTSTNFMDENSLILFAKSFNSNTSVLKCEVVTLKEKKRKKGLIVYLGYMHTCRS